jgi:hypothetical protein
MAKRAVVGLLLLTALAGAAVGLLNNGTYGFSIFILTPATVGALAAWIVRPATTAQAAALGASATVLAVLSLLAVGSEGMMCILMALPLAVPLGVTGSLLIYKANSPQTATSSSAILLLLAPAAVAWDIKATPLIFKVRSAIEIAASPEQVWKHVISFPDLPEPREWFFRTGLAYPQRARIFGSGVGAVRYCEFSTGTFVEPIEVWNEPRLLRFNVTASPAPMREWSPWAHVSPQHLRGYLISKQGEFRLTLLPNRHTLLEGTTCYQHGLWPAQYWRWWSDAIIHRIHLRVLNHIRALAENDAMTPRPR